MRTEEEIKRKIEFLELAIRKAKEDFIEEKIDVSFYKSKAFAIDYFTSALKWVLEEGEE